jgi:hypothetical protein
MNETDPLPPNIAAFVRRLATEHGIAYRPTALDALAAAISRLADDETAPYETADLLLCLARAGVLAEPKRFALHAACLRERDGAGQSHSGSKG